MMQPISFWVAGEPKGQPRPKATKRGKHAAVYDPGTANEWKARVHIAARDILPASPLTEPLRVDLTFFFPRPKGHYRSGKRSHELKDGAPLHHTGKPDRDNADKAIMDQLTVSRMWMDDSQVCDGRIRKLYEDGRGPGVLIEITEAQ